MDRFVAVELDCPNILVIGTDPEHMAGPWRDDCPGHHRVSAVQGSCCRVEYVGTEIIPLAHSASLRLGRFFFSRKIQNRFFCKNFFRIFASSTGRTGPPIPTRHLSGQLPSADPHYLDARGSCVSQAPAISNSDLWETVRSHADAKSTRATATPTIQRRTC